MLNASHITDAPEDIKVSSAGTETSSEVGVPPSPSASLDAPDLRKLVDAVAPAVPRANSKIPVLSCVGLTFAGGAVTARATDLDVEVVCTTGAELSAPFSGAIHAKPLLAILTALGAERVDLALSSDNLLEFRGGDISGKLPTLPVTDMPAEIDGACRHPFAMAAGDLLRLLDAVSHAISTEETRYYLNGVYLHRDDGKLFAVATDGHRMAIASLAAPADGANPPLDAGMILPRTMVRHLLRLLALLPADVPVEVRPYEEEGRAAKIALTWSRSGFATTVAGRLVDGTFPNYRKVIPANNDKTLIAYRGLLRRAVKTASALYGSKERGVNLVLDKGSLTVSAESVVSGSLSARVTVISSCQIEVGASYRYLIDCLDAFEGEAVRISLSDAAGPIMVEPAEDGRPADQRDRVTLMQLLMPMHI